MSSAAENMEEALGAWCLRVKLCVCKLHAVQENASAMHSSISHAGHVSPSSQGNSVIWNLSTWETVWGPFLQVPEGCLLRAM